jgi:FlaA1/EpsC-like NDP-sugar epimerase
MDVNKIIGRSHSLFEADILRHHETLSEMIGGSKILVVGGGGTIGQAVCNEIFHRNPSLIDVVDISENNLVELVRALKSSPLRPRDTELNTVAIDVGSKLFDAYIQSRPNYDFIVNLSALKHVRSEKDPFTLMRMVEVNIVNAVKIAKLASSKNTKKYFCVSTDKAANPVNLMGATKRVMEKFLINESENVDISMARFANVAFSDGSLLYGFKQRFEKNQPLTAPADIQRYFITPEESGKLCLLSLMLGENLDIFFPNNDSQLKLQYISNIALQSIISKGYEPYVCNSEEEALSKMSIAIERKIWPIYLFDSDTVGEKSYEEFYMENENIDTSRFHEIGVIKNKYIQDESNLENFMSTYHALMDDVQQITKEKIVNMISALLPELIYKDFGKYLDKRM